MNAVENMQSYEHVAKTHAQQLQKLVPAFRNFYKFGVRPAKRNRRPSIPGERGKARWASTQWLSVTASPIGAAC